MKIFVKLLSILIVCVVVRAQEREDSDDRQSVQQFQRPTVLDQNPIRRIVGGIRERVKEGSTRVREGSTRVVSRIQSIIADVRKRSEELEQNLKDELQRLRPQVVESINQLKALEVQKKQLNERIKVVNNQFEDKKSEYRSALKEQKTVIDNQIRDTDVKDPNVGNELKTESERLDQKIKTVDDLQLVPQTRGLGDGYGRHLK